MNNVKTGMKFGDKGYAFVPDRLKEFREQNPRAKIDSNPTYNEDGSITFKTTITKDQADEHSAIGTGNARYSETELKKIKAFEKLETVSVGRALSNLGYLNSGEIASTEELEEFYEYKDNQILEAVETLQGCKSLDELKQVFMSLGSLMAEKAVVEAKDNRKAELTK